MKREELDQRLVHLEMLVESVLVEREPDQSRLDRIQRELFFCSNLLTELDKFTKMNYTTFLKILKKHDKLTRFALRTMFLMRLAVRPFYAATFDEELHILSKLYSVLNSLRSGPSSSSESNKRTLKRKHRFWVHPDNVTELKIEILKHLPVIVFSRQKTDYDAGVSAVYLDNESLDIYKDRLEDTAGSEVIRIRWNGPPGQDLTDSKVQIERKTLAGGFGLETAAIDRLEIKEKYLNDFLAGKWTTADKLKKKREKGSIPESQILALESLAFGIQRSISERNLRPVLGVHYNREDVASSVYVLQVTHTVSFN
jgi:SPX domain protein involved in polyphosphate accumulation